MKDLQFSTYLLNWYAINARSLPWRNHPDPYAVWVSEVMLQQTRVEAVIPYFTRWMVRFPNIQALSKASLQEVLAIWEGLGYYGRARNLHKTAQIVIQEFHGHLPELLFAEGQHERKQKQEGGNVEVHVAEQEKEAKGVGHCQTPALGWFEPHKLGDGPLAGNDPVALFF